MSSRPERLFESAVGQYARYRAGYPSREVDVLADLVGLEHSNTVIDVGCGTGQLAIPLARHAGEVIAIDPIPDMLAVGRQHALAAKLTNITWILGDSSKPGTVVGPGAHVATFAASFHWTDRAEVARVLDTLLDDKGSIVVINDDLDDDEQPRWVHVVTDLRNRYLGNEHTAATAAYTDPPVSHREVLASSPFAAVERLTWTWERRLTERDIVPP